MSLTSVDDLVSLSVVLIRKTCGDHHVGFAAALFDSRSDQTISVQPHDWYLLSETAIASFAAASPCTALVRPDPCVNHNRGA
jgi:hypothetical protein